MAPSTDDETEGGALVDAGATKPLEGLERGFSVLQLFSEHPQLTLAEAAQYSDIPRASVRRILHTLVQQRYLVSDGRQFSATPAVLRLGWSYMAARTVQEVMQPSLEELAVSCRATATFGQLQAPDVIYLARAASTEAATVGIRIGTRLPAYCSAVGRVLLAGLDEVVVERILARSRLEARTGRTVHDHDALLGLIATAKSDGFALVDQEVEMGLCSFAVPVIGRGGRAVGAIEMSTYSLQTSAIDLLADSLEPARAAAEQLSMTLQRGASSVDI